MDGRFGQRDLLAGGIAAVVLAALVFPLGATPWIAIPLAVVTYVGIDLFPGIWWLRPDGNWRGRPGRDGDGWPANDIRSATPEEIAYLRAYEDAAANLAAIDELAQEIAKPTVREQLGRILDQTERLLDAMREDGNLAAAPLLDDHVLQPTLALLAEYVRLAGRDVQSAAELLARTETHDLPLIEQALDDFYEKLHRGHVVDLATLGEVLEFNLESITTTSFRRFAR